MKLYKRNRQELRVILVFVLVVVIAFLWIAQTIGFPVKTKVVDGRTKAIDVSSYNGNINWKQVKDQDITYVMFRIGTGIHGERKGSEDRKFGSNFRKAGYAAMHRGVYYYSYATTVKDAKAEAKHCLKLLDKYDIEPEDLDMPVAYDVEDEKALATGKKNVTAMTKAFCDEIQKAGYTPMLYSGAYALNNYFIEQEIRKYKIWVAHYTKEDGPDLTYDYDMWQYSDKASVKGANTGSGHCDVNYYIVKDGEE